MSAYIVRRETIHTLVTAGLRQGAIAAHAVDVDTLGKMLWDENIVSVSHRYPGEETTDLPGTMGGDHVYHYEAPVQEESAIDILEAIGCFRYQSCEHPGWKTSPACQYIEWLEPYWQGKAEDEKKASALEAQVRREAKHEAAKRFNVEEFQPRVPVWAQAVIVAEYVQDDCDIQSDYFNTVTERTLILAWSKHTRDLFSEMRKAALNAPETAHLGPGMGLYTATVVLGNDARGNGLYHHQGEASPWHRELQQTFPTRKEAEDYVASQDAPGTLGLGNSETMTFAWKITEEDIEHREKWSMGNGYYLKAGRRYSSGWEVHKTPLSDDTGRRLYPTEWRIPTAKPTSKGKETPTETLGTPCKPTIRKGTRPGMIEVAFPNKPPAEYIAHLKSKGFRWAKQAQCWYGPAKALGWAIFI